MTEFVIFSLSMIIVCGIGLARNELVYRVRLRRIDAISAACKRDIGRCPDFIAVMEARYAELNSPGYTEMVLDLRRWTYEQFYPMEPI